MTIAMDSKYRSTVRYKTVQVEGVDLFYREAGGYKSPALLLLHGFPASSNMFRNIISKLVERFRIIAPDYPGYGFSSMPDHKSFSYSFENLALVMDAFTEKIGLDKYIVYLMDYGAPIGLRMALNHPERIAGLIVQNGNAHEEGLRDFWNPMKAYWADPSPENFEALFLSDPRSCEVAVHQRRPRHELARPDHMGTGSGWTRPSRQCGDSTGHAV